MAQRGEITMRKHTKRKQIRVTKHTPTILEVRAAFNPLDRFIADLEAGEMSVGAIAGKEEVYFEDDMLDRYPVAPVLDGWISCWERFIRVFGLALDLAPLRTVHKKLKAGVLITQEEVTAAKTCIDTQRKIYRTLDVYKVRDAANTEQIAIELENAREAA